MKPRKASRGKGIVYDLYGTLVLTDCLVTGHYSPRPGVVPCLERQRDRGLRLACFADDDKDLVDRVLEKSYLSDFFDEVHYGRELDEDGLKKLDSVRFRVLAFVGDMPRDERAAEKYGVSFVKVPPFTVKGDAFDFSKVAKALESAASGNWLDYAKGHHLKRLGDEDNVEFAGSGQRIRFGKSRWAASFY